MNMALQRKVTGTFEQVLQKVPEALKTEGFGVLTQIDVKDTFKKKLDVDFRHYTILGACNPTLAHRALSMSLDVGTLLPCNVVVYEGDDGQVTVQAIDPVKSIGALGGDARFLELATTVRGKLERVLTLL